MEVLVLVLSFVILLVIGVPIAFSIGIAGILTMLMSIDTAACPYHLCPADGNRT